MAGATARIPMNCRILMCETFESDNSDECEVRLADSVFEFLNDDGESSESISSNGYGENEGMDEDEERENKGNGDDDKAYWENQHQLLHATLRRSSSLESKIRNATKEALKEAQMAGNYCVCRRPVAGGCRNCLMREVCGRLQNSGFNAAICRSKWRSSPDIPSGEHTFIDVVENCSSKKGEVRVIIEINFGAEFMVARASEEYNKLIKRLPEVFVGKFERLQNLIKILCCSAKKCMKGNKMHMGPWRKHKYMQAKWLGTCERTVPSTPPVLSAATYERPPRPRRTSMLTMDLLENLSSNLHMPAVEVV